MGREVERFRYCTWVFMHCNLFMRAIIVFGQILADMYYKTRAPVDAPADKSLANLSGRPTAWCPRQSAHVLLSSSGMLMTTSSRT